MDTTPASVPLGLRLGVNTAQAKVRTRATAGRGGQTSKDAGGHRLA